MSEASSRSPGPLSLRAAAAPSSAGNSSTTGEWIPLEVHFRREVSHFIRWGPACQALLAPESADTTPMNSRILGTPLAPVLAIRRG
jgi:hypothetical protein